MIHKKLANFTLDKENLKKLAILAQLLNKNKSRVIDDLIAGKFNELDKKKMLELIEKNIAEIEEIQKL